MADVRPVYDPRRAAVPITADKLRTPLVLLIPGPTHAPALTNAAARLPAFPPAAAAAALSSAPSTGGLVGTREAFRIPPALWAPVA